jgi:hypothetical protein
MHIKPYSCCRALNIVLTLLTMVLIVLIVRFVI